MNGTYPASSFVAAAGVCSERQACEFVQFHRDGGRINGNVQITFNVVAATWRDSWSTWNFMECKERPKIRENDSTEVTFAEPTKKM